jgi:predicted HTH domain antitoxin
MVSEQISLIIPRRIREKFLREILEMYSLGELSANRASQMLGIPKAAFYELLAEANIPQKGWELTGKPKGR